MPTIIYATQFVLDTLLTFLTSLLILRFLFQMVRADFYNPLCQFIMKMTDKFVKPLRKFVPGYFGIDWATLIVILLVSLFNQVILVWLSPLVMTSFTGLILITIGDVFRLTYYIYLFASILLVFSSWLAPSGFNPVLVPLMQLLNPPLHFIRRFIKPVSGFDLSFFVLMIGLIVIDIIVIIPMMRAGEVLLGG